MTLFDNIWKGLVKRLFDSEPSIVEGEDPRYDSYLEYVKKEADSVPENNMHRVILAKYRELRNIKFSHEESLKRAKEAGIRWEATRRRMMSHEAKKNPLAKYLPTPCWYCGKPTLRYVKGGKIVYCDSCGASKSTDSFRSPEKQLPALYLPDSCKHCGQQKLRYIKGGKTVYCDNCGWSSDVANFRKSEVPSKAISQYGPADHHKCRNCGFKFPATEDACPRCHVRFGKKRETVSELSAMESHAAMIEREEEEMESKLKGLAGRLNLSDKASNVLARSSKKSTMLAKVYEALTFIFIGILCLFIPSFLGIPINFSYLAIAFMVFIPLYIVFPSKHHVLDVYGKDIGTQAIAGFLVPKAMFKILAFVFILLQFSIINLMATLAMAFIFYFLMPFSYRSDQPYEMIESWARFGFGICISILFMITFGFANQVGWSLALMSAAFFATFPVHQEAGSGSTVVVNVGKKMSSVTDSPIGKLFFVVLMFASLFLAFSGVAITWNFSQIIFILLWVVSLIVGISTTAEGRPAIGIVMIFIALFAFSGMYTGVVGQAVFGYWWPQIQSFGESYLGPLNDAWFQAQSGIGDSWEMLTCPQCYYTKMQQKQQATKSVVKEGGSRLSMETTKFDIFPSIPGTFEPGEPLIGSIEITNSGEYGSNYLDLKVWASWKDVSSATPVETNLGSFQKMTCSGRDDAQSCPSTSNCMHCEWTPSVNYPKVYPTEKKLSTFVYSRDSWGLLGDKTEIIKDDGTKLEVYEHAGETVKINANLTYNYEVNVSIPMEVIGFNRYVDLLENRQIELIDLTSQYSGGPVKATIWTPKQPIRTDEPSIVVASIVNEGSGVVKNVDYHIAIPAFFRVEDISSSFRGATGSATDLGCRISSAVRPGYVVVECNHNKDIKPQEFKRVSFFIYPKLDVVPGGKFNANTERDTSLITGYGYYTYLKTTSQTLTVANAPPE